MRITFIAPFAFSALCMLVTTSVHAQTTGTPDSTPPPLPPANGTNAPSGTSSPQQQTQAPAPSTQPTPGPTAPSSPPSAPTPGGIDNQAPKDPQTDLLLGTAGARAVGLAPPGSNPSDFMDTRLTWTFGDDDFTHKTGELLPLSPNFSIGDRPQYRLFFDNLNSRYSGRENLTHLVLYKKMPGFIERLTTEAAVVLRFDLASLSANTGNLNSALYDAGSYLRIFYQTGKHEKEGLSAVFFPLDTDRFRLGYLYDISWGGTNAGIRESIFPRIQGSSPGLKLQYDRENMYAFVGFKTATIVQPQQVLSPGGDNDVETVRVGETNYGLLFGAGVDPHKNLRFDLGGGYFQQGKFDLDDVRGRSIYTYGGAGRVVVHHNMPVPQSVDFRLYRNDPSAPQIMFAPERYKEGEVSWSVSAEADVLGQHLKDFDKPGAVKDQLAYGTAVQAVVKASYLRLSVSGIMRNLNFVVRNVPGFIPFETLPSNAKAEPEMFGAFAADYFIQSLHLTPGVGGGIQLPATFRSEFTEGGVPASRTTVVRQNGDESILPYNKDRTPIFQARVSLRWDLSKILSAMVWGQFVRDNNGTLVVRDPTEGTASLRVFQSPNRLGAGLSLQARF
ncbi:hypothetical protein LZC95_31885 [Pendulispora brunnea]|uniref:Uncharacterized protein n=1 Tax=Pendulispora brunnea TaxID=2905690 RepID=A0ABZ2K1I1_9BACT